MEEDYGYYDDNMDFHLYDEEDDECNHIYVPCNDDKGNYLGYGRCKLCGYYA